MLLLGSPLIALYLAQRYFSGKSKPGWAERWGRLPAALEHGQSGKTRLWIHAVSAGEVVAAVPILREIRLLAPDAELLLSVITPAGMEMAEQQAAKYTNGLFYFPFDLPWVARRVVRTIRPDVFISLESEMWPNALHELKSIGARTVMVNGRISDKNFQRAMRSGGFLFRWMLGNMDRLLMQSEADAERIRALGRFAEDSRVAVLGNSKFDQEIVPLSSEQVQDLRRKLHLPENAMVFVAGSTRSTEEEAEIIEAYKIMRESYADLCLVVAPRQIDHAKELAEAMRSAGLEPVCKTELEGLGTVPHLILNTMGDLANTYAVADLVFVGNSFAPVVKGGGQNLLQPLAHGKPVFFGPLTATIRSEVSLVTQAEVGFQVANGAELAQKGTLLLNDVPKRREIERNALALIAANRGVSARYAAAILELVKSANRAAAEQNWRGDGKPA